MRDLPAIGKMPNDKGLLYSNGALGSGTYILTLDKEGLVQTEEIDISFDESLRLIYFDDLTKPGERLSVHKRKLGK